MLKKRENLNTSNTWYILYIFFAVFQPPILPISFIYVLGIITFILLGLEYRGVLNGNVLNKCKLNKLIYLFGFMFCYLIVIDIFGVITSSSDLFNNRLRCINQLVVLSLIQFLAIWYIILLSEKRQYTFEQVLKNLITVGGIQGVCAIAAYISPAIRSIFTRYADQVLFTNAFFVERRGYGFSGTLIDTFGYGMGLIGGYLILSDLSKDKLKKSVLLCLIVFSIFMNARTGLVILAIAFLIKLVQAEKLWVQIGKVIIAVPILYLIVFVAVPKFFDATVNSSNITISWVMQDLQELYNTLIFGRQTGASLADASFLSNFSYFPTDALTFIFGSGHSIYDTGAILGFRTDVGYINLLWEFGVFGSIIIIGGMMVWMLTPFFKTKDAFIKSIVLFNAISYLIVMFKAILIGYNPGVFVNYFTTALVYFYVRKKAESVV